MAVQEKQAWFMWVVITATVLLVIVVGYLSNWHEGSLGVFGLAGLSGFAPMIGRKERKAGNIIVDERDIEIARVSTLAGYSIFWVIFVAVTMAPFFYYGPNETITLKTSHISFLVFPAMCIVFWVRSLVMIVLYRRGYGYDR